MIRSSWTDLSYISPFLLISFFSSLDGGQHTFCMILLGMLFVQELSAGLWNCRIGPHVFGALTQFVVSVLSSTDAMQILFANV